MEIIFTPPDECIQCITSGPCNDCPMFTRNLNEEDAKDRLKKFLIYWALTGGPLHLLTHDEKKEPEEE
jgi:hypothetical protein